MNAQEIIDKYRLDKRTWTPKGFHACLHTFIALGDIPIKPYWEYHGDAYELSVEFVDGDMGYWMWNDEDMERLRTAFIANVNKDPCELTRYNENWHRLLKSLATMMQTVEDTDLSALSDEELYDLYEKWFDVYIEQYGPSVNLQDAFSMHSARFLEPHFRKIITEDFHEKCALLLSPVVLSFLQNEEKELLEIRKRQLAGDDIEELLRNHATKWHWIQNNYKVYKVLTPDDFRKRLDKIDDPVSMIQKIDDDLENVKREKIKLIEALQLDKESLNLVRITEVFAAMQDERKKYAMWCIHHQFLFMEECARRLGWSLGDMEWTYFRELKDVMAGNVTLGDIEERKKFFVAIRTENDSDFIGGDVAKEIYERVFAYAADNVAEVQGSVASPGKATGTVRVVLTAQDAKKLRDGEVLVTTMTRPDIAFAMKKAAAIVTDEGGITSHAAIVARELGIPCIVGTRAATKVLKDGDFVEVNADHGIVRKVNL